MGGCGSGQYCRYSSKSTNENFHRFSISRLKEFGLIGKPLITSGSWQWTCNDRVISSISYDIRTLYDEVPHLRVYYTNKNSGKDYDYKIYLTTTTPPYGGVRWWFKCPAANCGRRVGVLYLGSIFACRKCHNMAYASQRQQMYDRMNDKAFKIARQLGHDGNVIDGFWGKKPKGMHWKTYNRKVAFMNNAAAISLAGALSRFGNIF